MIHFYPELVAKAEKIVAEARDLMDTTSDLSRINNAISAINFSNAINLQNTLQRAQELDVEMRQKHPMIKKMLRIANSMPRIVNTSTAPAVANAQIDEVEALRQDYFGILYEVLVKKGLISSAEQFIERVNV